MLFNKILWVSKRVSSVHPCKSFRKLNEYNPTHSMKEYERPAMRRNIPTFAPESALDELIKEKISEQESELKLAKHFQNVIINFKEFNLIFSFFKCYCR